MHIFEFNKNNCFKDLFKGQILLEFAERFPSDIVCIEYLSHFKWYEGYMCVK